MAVTQVSYARLYNIGNFENIRFEATASVGADGAAAAFDEAVAAVHDGYVQWKADREAEEVKRRNEIQRQREQLKNVNDVPF